jgi:hypothetical protein
VLGTVEQLSLPAPQLAADGRAIECKSWLAYAGGYQLTLWTIVPELALELHSSYLGHPDGETAIAHLQLQPGDSPAIVSEQRPGLDLPVRDARRLCLYDHLEVLRRRVADHTGAVVGVEVADQALELVDLS